MFIYLFPIFAFGLVITGVVFLGLQQAADWARELEEQKKEAHKRARSSETPSPEHNSSRRQAPYEVNRS